MHMVARTIIAVLCLLPLAALGCSQQSQPHRNAAETWAKDSSADGSEGKSSDAFALSSWPNDWSARLGQEITLEGAAVDAKLGALLLGEENSIWIDGLDAWPDGFYLGGDKGKRVRVTGTLIVKHDLPVFIQKPGETPKSGVPVPEGTDLHEASKRFLLKDARWASRE